MQAEPAEVKENTGADRVKRLIVDLTVQGDNDSFATSNENSWKPFYLSHVAGLPAEHNVGTLQLHDILAGEFEEALLTNYHVDLEWMISECPRLVAPEVNVVVVHGYKDMELQREIRRMAKMFPNLSISACRLPTHAFRWGTHHSKVAIVFYATGIRVAIMTNNYVEGDWTNKTQCLWVEDFPLKDAASPPSTEFEDYLTEYFSTLDTWDGDTRARLKTVIKRLSRYDYSAAQVDLVASVPGIYHSRAQMSKYGHLRMQALLTQSPVTAAFHQGSKIAAQYSSQGALGKNEKFVDEVLRSFMGYTAGGSAPGVEFQLIWPRLEDVRNCNIGYRSGGSIPCNAKNMFVSEQSSDVKPRLRQLLHVWDGSPSGRARAMPHIKTYCRYRTAGDDHVHLAWALITSCNFSQPAWGTLQKNNTQFSISSWELGVLFQPHKVTRRHRVFSCTPDHPVLGLVPAPASASASASAPAVSADYFVLEYQRPPSTGVHAKRRRTGVETGTTEGSKHDEAADLVDLEPVALPLPHRLPARKYAADDVPWVWDRNYLEPDITGQVWLPGGGAAEEG